jgi:flagellar basal-body rod protein FlgB
MFENLELLKMAGAMSQRAGARMSVVAQNIANADTPGFKAMDLPSFAETYDESGAAMRATRSGHFATDAGAAEPSARRAKGTAAPNGNTVSLEQEMVKTATIRQDHEMALSIYRASTDILRASLGRT